MHRSKQLTNARQLLPIVAIIALLALTAGLLACGSDPTAEPAAVSPPTASQPTAAAAPTEAPAPASATAEPEEPTRAAPTEAAPTPPTSPQATAVMEPTATAQPEPTAEPAATPTATPVPATAVPEPPQVTVTSTDGTEVVFESPPERMVVYDGAAVEMLYAIGQGHRIAGTHSFVTYPPETESIAKIGDAFNMDIEAIVALDPDLVYVFYDRFNEDLERAGLKVLYIKSLSHGFTEISDQLRMWGAITGATEEAEKAASEFDARVAAIEEKVADVETAWTVYEHGFEWWTPGRNTLVNDVFELLQLQNVADFEGYQQISPEVVVAANPDIIIGDPDSVAAEPAFAGMHAAEPHHVFTLSEGNSFSVAGPRFMDAVEEFAAWTYPNLFTE